MNGMGVKIGKKQKKRKKKKDIVKVSDRDTWCFLARHLSHKTSN